MTFFFKLVFISILLIDSISGEPSDDDYDYSLQVSSLNSTINSTYDEDMSGRCSDEHIINHMIDIFAPEDYEEGKRNIKTRFETFNDTLHAIYRLTDYVYNISRKMSEINKRLNNRFSEVLMNIDLPYDCMRSLIRIGQAAQDGELWALKCLNKSRNF